MISKLVLTGAAAALAATSLAAEAAPAHRAPAEVAGQNDQIVGLLWQYLLLPIILGAVVALISSGRDQPTSP